MAFRHWTWIEYSIEQQDFMHDYTAYLHYLSHTLLFQCIFAGEWNTNVFSHSLYYYICRLIVSKQLQIKLFN